MTAIRHHGRSVRLHAPDANSGHRESAVARHVALALAATVVLIAAFAHPVAASEAVAESTTTDAAAVAERLRGDANDQLRALDGAIASASTVWEESAERVLEPTARTTLQKAITRAERVTRDVRAAVVWPGTTLEQAFAASTEAISGARAELATGIAGVEESVAAWEAEQARLAAEEAARQAAEAAAAAAAARVAAPTAGPAGASGMHLETIWTSGGQAQIDACRGAVNVTAVASYLGAGFYAAEHWSCGGSAWGGITPSSLVDFAGYGTYRVAGRIGGLTYGADASVLPAGYAGYYQTCIGGSSSNMTVWLLARAD